MTQRRYLFSFGATKVYIHPAVLIVAVYMLWLGKGFYLLVSTVSILLHEAAHSLVSALMGKPPEEMEITPLGALMRLDDEESLPIWQRGLILLSGPVASLFLCWAAIALTRHSLIPSAVGKVFFSSNLLIAMLNLLPALPLDGGRMLALILSIWLNGSNVRKVMRSAGILLGMLMIGVDIFLCVHLGTWNFSLCLAGCFLIYAASAGTTTKAMAELRRLMDRKIALEKRGVLRGKLVAVNEKTQLSRAVEQLAAHRYTLFCVLETGTMRLLSCVGEERLSAAYLEYPWATCSELIKQEKQDSSCFEKPCHH